LDTPRAAKQKYQVARNVWQYALEPAKFLEIPLLVGVAPQSSSATQVPEAWLNRGVPRRSRKRCSDLQLALKCLLAYLAV
jgi:hypothetical protein